jgi:hypothetical protein
VSQLCYTAMCHSCVTQPCVTAVLHSNAAQQCNKYSTGIGSLTACSGGCRRRSRWQTLHAAPVLTLYLWSCAVSLRQIRHHPAQQTWPQLDVLPCRTGAPCAAHCHLRHRQIESDSNVKETARQRYKCTERARVCVLRGVEGREHQEQVREQSKPSQ